ncbi:MAG: hypothetical protein C4543_11150 [Ignavibacteriales bacterium]|jgi:hypothetical protein|nr:MAG: hypothetical protein C4543_11150 [Ignavibacteriales bacterium]
MRKIKGYDLKLINIFVGLLASLMIVLTVLVLKDSDTSFTGLEIAFGNEFANLGQWASGEIAFNPLVLLAFVLPLIGGLIPLYLKNGYLISTILFVVSTILILLIPEFTTVTVTILGNVNEIDVEWSYGIGLFLAVGLSILGVMIGLLKLSEQPRIA